MTAGSGESDTRTATLLIDGKEHTFPVVVGSEGEVGIDVRKLRTSTGLITLDPGYGSTGACRSAITFINGEKGILRYRGYPIEQLAASSNFLEVAWLLIYGELPTKDELDGFVDRITHHTMLHEDFRRFMSAFPKSAHPMPVSAATVGALATFYQDAEDEQSIEDAVVRLLAKMPTIAAYAHKHALGQPFMYPQNDLSYAANFMQMMFGTPCEKYESDPLIAKVIDQLFILHADHEQNCSTSTVRLVGSSQPPLFAAIAAGISALWGPLHGGANQRVVEMLQRIMDEGGNPDAFLARAKDPDDPFRLMGFGHRVYKNFDPRATILKDACRSVLDHLGQSNQLLDIAMRLEEVTLRDEYFVQRNLYPNVDFYSGIIYKAIGIPVEAFTVMFAIGRLPGWIAQWREMRRDPDFRIGRPRQIYTGANERAYVPMGDR